MGVFEHVKRPYDGRLCKYYRKCIREEKDIAHAHMSRIHHFGCNIGGRDEKERHRMDG